MVNKVVAIIMGQDCEKFIRMCLESVWNADKIIYLDGGSTDATLHIVGNSFDPDDKTIDGEIIENRYNQDDPQMNGKQRNFYLKYLKENYKDWTCLCLDADEVLMDNGIQIIKQVMPETGLVSPRIHHFIGDLGHEDATRDKHYVPNRLFKITDDLSYPEFEHPVLQGKQTQLSTEAVEIWHLREVLGIFGSNKKHLNNKAKSNIHSQKYLDWWHKAMIFGYYPKKPVYYGAIPTPIKNYFDL